MSADTRPPRGGARLLLASALLGFALGLCWPAWHVALEPAQLLAGLVRYPVSTPFELYETRVWNAWHQLLAPLLALGVPERVLTLALSGVVAALGFVAISGFAAALGASARLALGAPLLVLMNGFYQGGFSYPVLLLGFGHTYGMVGLLWMALVCAALAAERWRSAGVLLGLAPAFHASLGAWLALGVAVAAFFERAALRDAYRALGAGTVVGALLSAASLALHATAAPAPPPLESALAAQYLDAFVRLWDAHRVPADLGGRSAFVVGCGMLAALLLLRAQRERLGTGAALALRVLLFCGVIGFAGSVAQRLLPPETIPAPLLIAMPTRLANLFALLFVPFAVAVLWRLRDVAVARLPLLVAVLVLAQGLGAPLALHGVELRNLGEPLLGIAAVAAVSRAATGRAALRIAAGALVAWLALRLLWSGAAWLGLEGAPALLGLLALAVLVAALCGALARETRLRALERRATPALDALLAVALAGIAGGVVLQGATDVSKRVAALDDWTQQPVLAEAARRDGLLLVGPGVSLAQLRTRRPLLLDPSALDMLPYALSAAPAMEAILRDAYGIDFFRPPRTALHQAGVPMRPVHALWERRTPDEWRALRARYGVRDVLVDARFRLRLPKPVRAGRYALYALPE